MSTSRCNISVCDVRPLFFCSCSPETTSLCARHAYEHLSNPGTHLISRLSKARTQEEQTAIAHTIETLRLSAEHAVQAELLETHAKVEQLLREVADVQQRCQGRIREIMATCVSKVAQLQQLRQRRAPPLVERSDGDPGNVPNSSPTRSVTLPLPVSSRHMLNSREQVTSVNTSLQPLPNECTLEQCQRRIEFYRETGDLQQLLKALLELAELYEGRQQIDEAINAAKEGAQLSRIAGSVKYEARCLNVAGTLFCRKQAFEEGIPALSSAAELFEAAEDHMALAVVLMNLGKAQSECNECDDAIDTLKRAIECSKQLGLATILQQSLRELGSLYSRKQTPHLAVECYQEIIELSHYEGDTGNLLVAYHYLGTVYHNNQCFDEAMTAYQKCLSLCRERGDGYRLATTLISIAGTFSQKRMNEDAIVALKESIELLKPFGYKRELDQAYQRLSRIYLNIGHTTEAMEASAEALKCR